MCKPIMVGSERGVYTAVMLGFCFVGGGVYVAIVVDG